MTELFMMAGRWVVFEQLKRERDSVEMASVGVAPTSGLRETSGHAAAGVDRLPEEMNDMKIRDDRVCQLSCHPLC